MIETAVDGVFYRAHTPEWASDPKSGAGAAIHGGRFNRRGLHALYLADSVATATAEYKQLDTILKPCTLAAYAVRLSRVVDFRDGFTAGLWSPLWQEWRCDWRRILFNDGIDPPSWDLGDEVQRSGCTGLLFPSTACTGINLMVLTSAIGSGDELRVHDPDEELPRNRSSWRA